ncbi:hypothetical protein LB515_08030 [Mesorhizobium sp. CA15]|uniref:hypothetical protein n=1 Tax=Mesorhizobium sp. CA15 TaxID=2876641 RepID=UPI001CD0C87A|nr:hypothetical protein [Mesorhizobium sp. CA15]MBZ9865319.1 hypothetical protein [Mesorhizobium sp. CA15]
MSAIVTRSDCQRPDAPAGVSARRAFGPNHRWKVLGIGVAANAGFSATFSGIPATAVARARATTSTMPRWAWHWVYSVSAWH